MPFTVQELENISNAALDFHYKRGDVLWQSVQNKPLLKDMMSKQKTFPGGKEDIVLRVSGDVTTTIMGYTHDDTVTYQNPANIKSASFPWKEIHWGISCTLTELKKDGISITDSANGKGESNHSDREMVALANILEQKIKDMKEGSERGLNLMFWKDGTQDSKQVPGVRSFILNDPTSAVSVAGIDQVTNTWWRNRASLALTASTASDQNVINKLQTEFRQLRRYGTPKHKMYAGSSFIEWFEKELRAKGNYTLEGYNNTKATDPGMADIAFKGTPIEYDPTLDDMSLQKYLFVLDTNAIKPMVMEGEDMKRHNPARPEDKYVLYRAMTWTGGLVCERRNTSGVYSIA